MGDILILVEHRDNEVDTITLQLLNRGRQLADQMGVGLGAIILGSDIGLISDTIAGKGVDTVFTADYPELIQYNPELLNNILSDMVRNINPSLLLLGYTLLGMEIGPALSTRLGIPLISNCTDIELSPERLPIVIRPVYRGTSYVRVQGSLPLIVSIQKGALSGRTIPARQVRIMPVDVKVGGHSLRTEVVDVMQPSIGEVDLAKASVIVAVGRGIGQVNNLNLARKLASSLGGVIAATRPVIDMGWLPPEYQVGLSGKTVSPKVYVACGISGAAQHVAGMIDSQMIIAINKDPNAPIFSVAHYPIVGDLFQVLPALIESAERMKDMSPG